MQIYVSKDGRAYGPFSFGELKQHVESRAFAQTDLAWFAAEPGWVPICDVLGFAAPRTPDVGRGTPFEAPTGIWQSAAVARAAGSGRISRATTCLHIATGLYLVIGVALIPLFPWLAEDNSGFASCYGVFLFVCCAIVAGAMEVIAAGLRRRRYWAWVLGVVVFGVYAASLFMPLGIVGLFALFDDETKAIFEQNRKWKG